MCIKVSRIVPILVYGKIAWIFLGLVQVVVDATFLVARLRNQIEQRLTDLILTAGLCSEVCNDCKSCSHRAVSFEENDMVKDGREDSPSEQKRFNACSSTGFVQLLARSRLDSFTVGANYRGLGTNVK